MNIFGMYSGSVSGLLNVPVTRYSKILSKGSSIQLNKWPKTGVSRNRFASARALRRSLASTVPR